MWYKSYKIKFIKAISIAFMLLLLPNTSCNDNFAFWVNCSECYIEEPEYAEIEVTVSVNAENAAVPVTVFNGPFEDNWIVKVDTARQTMLRIWLPINRDYTLRAEYYKDNRLYYVIDGAKPRTKIDYESCSESCYYIVGNKVDLRLVF